ncbi:ABC transporter permease [Nosocomiicoccus ampullae]|uniref:ABC-2 type transport system permease protein n=1 Tax=Nosocomiicoccus ampullae TaxID=489910 RepID=A0A9Q2HE98_9STAP|nr:ABC transporter permease [Nosocomiicoccus ampullae]MBB5175193.1 ABC-2 type transport system permease protein [Nosocomiicoccus ampullae]QYA46428.1 ABC transporter permease [Nosocomiicoccus ampullae]
MVTLKAIKYELLLSIKSSIQYKIGFISDFVIFFAIYIIALFFQNGDAFIATYNIDKTQAQIFVLIGVIFWQLSIVALGFSSSLIESNFNTGTLELRLQSTVSPIILMFANVFISMIFSLLSVFVVLMFAYFYIELDVNTLIRILLSFIIVIPSIVGMFGIGLIFGGLTLIEKSIGQFIMLFQGILLFISNSVNIIHLKVLDLIPFTLGVDIARNFILNREISILISVEYILINISWLILGVVIFNLILKRQRKTGVFDTY